MAKFRALIEKPASKSNLSIKLDSDVAHLQDEVKQLLKKTGSKINLDRTLQPIIRDILQDAKHQLTEVAEEQSHQRESAEKPQAHMNSKEMIAETV